MNIPFLSSLNPLVPAGPRSMVEVDGLGCLVLADRPNGLTPQFQRLHEAMERQRVTLQDNPLGLQPELALVLETVGSVENFIGAVRRVEGMEWLGELTPD